MYVYLHPHPNTELLSPKKRQDAFEVWGIYIEIIIKPNEVTLARSMKGKKKRNIQKCISKTERLIERGKGLKSILQ